MRSDEDTAASGSHPGARGADDVVPGRSVRVMPGRLAGEVVVPGDKSISHRALVLGALAQGRTSVSGLLGSADVLATAAALVTLGAEVALTPTADGALEGTVAGPLREADDVVDCGNSGTSLRLLAGVVAGIDGLTVLTGDASLRRRPVDRVAIPLRLMGAQMDARGGGSRPPLVVRGGDLRPVDYASPVASAQVKSCVLLAGLSAPGRTTVTSPRRSRDHTERMLAHLGADVAREERDDGSETAGVVGGALRGGAFDVPGDPSSAAFWAVAAAGEGGAGPVVLPGLCVNPTRTGFLRVLEAMGAEIEVGAPTERSGEPVATVTVRPAALGSAVVDGATTVDALDELPVLAVAGAVSAGGLEVRDAAELRVKESDRIAGVARLLRALGGTVEERSDGFAVPGGQRLTGGRVDADGDHRIAMAAAVAATYASGPVEIAGFDVVATSYPRFLDDLRSLGAEVEA